MVDGHAMTEQLDAAVDAFRALWQTGDLGAWGEALSDDVRLLSPIFTATFEGRAEALQLYDALVERLGNVHVGEALRSGDAVAVPWWADAGSRRIEGVDFFAVDASGRISEVRVMIRTLVGIAAFSAAVGPSLARRRSPLRGVLARALTAPLSILFWAVDRVAPRLVKAEAGTRGR